MFSFNCNLDFDDHWNIEVGGFKYKFDCYSQICCPCVGVKENVNLTNAQKELFLWHWKLDISLHHIQELLHVHTAKESNGKYSLKLTVIKPKFASISNCSVPKCTYYELIHAKKCNPQVVWQHAIKEKDILALDQYQGGDFALLDQFVVSNPGQLLTGYR